LKLFYLLLRILLFLFRGKVWNLDGNSVKYANLTTMELVPGLASMSYLSRLRDLCIGDHQNILHAGQETWRSMQLGNSMHHRLQRIICLSYTICSLPGANCTSPGHFISLSYMCIGLCNAHSIRLFCMVYNRGFGFLGI